MTTLPLNTLAPPAYRALNGLVAGDWYDYTEPLTLANAGDTVTGADLVIKASPTDSDTAATSVVRSITTVAGTYGQITTGQLHFLLPPSDTLKLAGLTSATWWLRVYFTRNGSPEFATLLYGPVVPIRQGSNPQLAAGDGSIHDVLRNVAGVISFHSADTGVTLDASGNVSQLADVRGSGYLPLVGYGAPLPSYDAVNKRIRTDGTQNHLKTATDARFALNDRGCLIYLGTVEDGAFPCIVSTDTVSDYMAIHRLGSNPYYFGDQSSVATSPQSDLLQDTALHLFRAAWRKPGVYHGPGNTADSTVGYFSVGDDIRKWVEVNASSFSGTACSLAVGVVPGNGGHSLTTMVGVMVLDHEPTPTEWAAIRRYATARGAVVIGTRKQLSCIGDSITYGQGCTTPSTEAWPNLIAAAYPTTYAVDKRGRSGRWSSEANTMFQDLALNDANAAVATRWLTIWLGTNDIAGGAPGAVAFDAIKQMAQKALALGTLVLIITALKRTGFAGTSMETERVNLNNLILTMVSNGWATAVFDATTVCDPTDPTQSPDGIHPNSAKNVDLKNGVITTMQGTGQF